jgi:hypothetical protein
MCFVFVPSSLVPCAVKSADTFAFQNCEFCIQLGEDRQNAINWIEQILSFLPGCLGAADTTALQQCAGCLLPHFHRNCPPEFYVLFERDHRRRDILDDACLQEAFYLVAPALTSLRRTAVREAMGLDRLKPAYDMAKWLATPWPASPRLCTIHRLVLLHYFLLPSTRHSPLAGGFHVDPKTSAITPDLGPSEINLTYMRALEASIVFASIESVRPEITSTRTVEMVGLDDRAVISTETRTA